MREVTVRHIANTTRKGKPIPLKQGVSGQSLSLASNALGGKIDGSMYVCAPVGCRLLTTREAAWSLISVDSVCLSVRRRLSKHLL